MIEKLEGTPRELAEYMAEISERTYYAAWLGDIEYDLWAIIHDGPCNYGHSCITQRDIDNLRDLSSRCGGWIIFDDKEEEIFVPLEEWVKMFAANPSKVKRNLFEDPEGA